jgi:cystathionine beta-lyase/cystathionine gamma-synthase
MKEVNSHKIPIYRDSGFSLETTEKTLSAFQSEREGNYEPENYIYSRYRNPTVLGVEKGLNKILGSGWCMLSESGMASIDIALSICQESNDNRPWLFFTEIYGGTNTYIDTILLRRRNIQVERFAPEGDSYNMAKYIETLERVKPKLVYFETVSNPMLMVADCNSIISEAKKRDVLVITDNTFPTPFLFKPLSHGADLVIESVTKYLSGHGNITAGVLYGNRQDLLYEALEYRKWSGHMLSPDDASRLGTQLETFHIRYSRQIENAGRLASLLLEHPKIEKVFYPGLKLHPTHDLAVDLFENKGFGAIITFQMAGKTDEDKRKKSELFIKGISSQFELIPSLGDCKTIFMPVDAVWGDKYPYPGTIRLSLGIEEFSLIEATIKEALEPC